MVEPVAEPEVGEERLRPGLGAPPRLAPDAERERGVLHRGQFGQQAVVLEDEAHAAVAEGGGGALGKRCGVLPGEVEGAGLRPVEEAEHLEERGLADPAPAHDRHHLPGGGVEVETPEHRDPGRPGAEPAHQPAGPEERPNPVGGGGHWNRSASVMTSAAARRAG